MVLASVLYCSLCISQILFFLLHILVGLGDYKLHPRFVYATRSPQDIHLITYSPEEIVEMVMLKKKTEKCLYQASDGKRNIYNLSFIIYLNIR